MITQNASQIISKISSKSTILHYIMNEYLSKISFSWHPEKSSTCRIARRGVSRHEDCMVELGFTNFGTSCDVPDSVFRLYLRHFFMFFVIGDSSTSRISRSLECRPHKWLVKMVPPTFGKKKTFFGYVGRKESRNTQKKQSISFAEK